MTNQELNEIEARANLCEQEYEAACYIVDKDIPALVAEVRRLQESLSRAYDRAEHMGFNEGDYS